jgi:hypothetical protein
LFVSNAGLFHQNGLENATIAAHGTRLSKNAKKRHLARENASLAAGLRLKL